MGIVLGRADGVFPRLLNLVKLGIGGMQGNGNQYVSWIHELDAARSTEWLSDHPELEGVFNCTAPYTVKNAELMRIIRKIYGVPFGLPAPNWLLEAGAVIIGTETELILKSRWVVPQRLLTSGFVFQFEDAEKAVRNILEGDVK
jgi:NAD dependent epimerase/dehydratase family enzyme